MEVIGQSTDGKNRSKHRWKESVKASMEIIYQSIEPRENLMAVDAKGICSPKTKEELGDR
jgi:hypothetical protein